jgi:hypothetical protein
MFASFQNVLFVFDNGTDNDLAVYEYELYEEDDIVNPNTAPYALKSGATALKAGAGNSSVFAVPVEGSYIDVENDNVVVQKNFFGRVRAKDTSGNTGAWTAIVKTDPSTPLIDSQYIVSLTADKIKAGTIESAAIVLGGANPANTIIKSLTYDTSSGVQGWFIRGDGHFSLGGPNGITYNNSTITIGSAVQVQANLAADSISVGSGQNQLNINDGINGNAGGMTLGDPTYNYWYANGNFRVGGPSSYLSWNGSALTVVGGGTFSGALSGGTIQIGSGENVFKADSNGIYLGNETFANAEFRVTPAGALTATNATINGVVNAVSGTIGGWLIDSTGLSKTVSGSSSYIYPSQIVLGIQNEEVSGTTTVSAARLFIEDVNYYVRVQPSGIEINDQIYGGTSYFKQYGAQLYGSMNLIGGNLTATSSGGLGGTVSAVTCNATTFNGTLNGNASTATYATTAGLRINRILDVGANASGQDFIIANSDGAGVLRVATNAGVYSKVVTGRAVQVNSNDLIGTTASTARLKQDIEPYIFNEQAILSIEPKRFKYNEKVQHGGGDSDWQYGFIAEEAVTAGLSELCGFDEEGLPDYFAYERMCVAQQQIIRTLWNKVEQLESRLV